MHGRGAAMRASFVPLLITACASRATLPNGLSNGDAGTDGAALDGATSDGTTADAGPPPALAGINIPPTQGTSNAGAFMPGIYTWSYTNAQIAEANATFAIMRLPINVATANDTASLARLKGFIDQFDGHRAIICMFGTTKTGTGTHGDGLVDDEAAMATAWANIDAVFGSYPDVHYEILNEPFGYAKANPAAYVNAMKQIINDAHLPVDKCILDGMGYADDIQLVANAGWPGDLAYHFYPNWSSDHQQSTYSNLVQGDVGSLGARTWITEFGANLGFSDTCYQTFEDGAQPSSADVNALRGLDDAVGALRAHGHRVKGVFFWHGWNNGDTYDFWKSSNEQGACKVRLIQSHA